MDENGNQTFATETDIKWRIWDYDEEKRIIRIISDSPTDAMLTLRGVAGYNNGVWAINEVCRQCYSQYDGDKIKDGIEVANLRRSDIQKVSTYDYTEYKHEENKWEESTNGTVYLGDVENNNIDVKYPEIWEKVDSNWTYKRNEDGTKIVSDKECLIWEQENIDDETSEADSNKIFKQSYYYHNYFRDEFKNEKYYDLIFGPDDDPDYNQVSYWLAGRCTRLIKGGCYFDIQRVGHYIISGNIQGNVSGGDIYSTKEHVQSRMCAFRPIVSINLNSSNCNITKEEKDGKVTFKLNWK